MSRAKDSERQIRMIVLIDGDSNLFTRRSYTAVRGLLKVSIRVSSGVPFFRVNSHAHDVIYPSFRDKS